MRNLFFDMKIVFQKDSCCDGGVEASEGNFESSKADFRKLDVTKFTVKKTCNGSGGRGSVCGDDLIGGREIGTGDLVFLRRSNDNGMGTFGRHIDNTIKRSWRKDRIRAVRDGRKKCLYVITPLVYCINVASYVVDIALKNLRDALTSLKD